MIHLLTDTPGRRRSKRVSKGSTQYGLFRLLKSSFGAAIFFVAKKDGGLRLVTDYRALNEVTIKNRYPLPLIDNLFDALGGSQYFTKIDLTAGYHQIRVKPEDIPKTAFHTKYGSFKCVVLNFGMTPFLLSLTPLFGIQS